MITVFLCPPDRVGLPARIAALAERSGRTPEVVLLTGEDAARCLRGWKTTFGVRSFQDRREVKAHLNSLKDRGPLQLIVVDWVEALGWPEVVKHEPRLILDRWGSEVEKGESRKSRRARKWIQERAKDCLYIGLWGLIRSPEERVALEPLLHRNDPWSAAMWTETKSDAWFHELVQNPFILVRCPSLKKDFLLEAARHALENTDTKTSILLLQDGPEDSIAHSDRLVSCGLIPELYQALEKAKGVLLEPLPFLAFAASSLQCPTVICPYKEGEMADREADYLVQRFGATRGERTEPPATWMQRLMMGLLDPCGPAAVDTSLPAQQAAIGDAVMWLDRAFEEAEGSSQKKPEEIS